MESVKSNRMGGGTKQYRPIFDTMQMILGRQQENQVDLLKINHPYLQHAPSARHYHK